MHVWTTKVVMSVSCGGGGSDHSDHFQAGVTGLHSVLRRVGA